MATTLYGTFPILLPNKTISVSLYGLQKTSGTILFKPGQEDAARDLAEQEGSVFPDPQVRTTDIGLLEMSFDAYINTGATSGVFGTEIINLSKSFEATFQVTEGNNQPEPMTFNWTITESWIADSYTERKVLAASLSSVSLTISERGLNKHILYRYITGKTPPFWESANWASQLQITWGKQVSSVMRRNLGEFDEVDIVTSLSATIA